MITRFQNLPIRRRLNRVILAICGCVLLLTASALAVFDLLDYRRAMARDATLLADVVATNVSGTLAFDDDTAARQSLAALHSDPHVVFAALYRDSGHLFTQYQREGTRESVPVEPGLERAAYEAGRLTVVRPVTHDGRRLGTLLLRLDLAELNRRILVFSLLVVVTLVVAGLVAALLSAWLQKPITAPILRLAETAKFISEHQDFTVRAEAADGGEIGTLTAAFNAMLAAIEEARRELVASNAGLREESAERQRAERRASAQAARLAQLNEITRAISERQDVESVFQIVAGSLETQLPADLACLCTYDEERDVLNVATIAHGSLALASEAEILPPFAFPVEANALGRCLRGEVVYEPNALTVALPLARRLSAAGVRSLALAPLRVESRVFGVLLVARRMEAAFSSNDCEFLRQLGEHVAVAAQQAQLYAALQGAYDDLRQTQQAVMQQERLRALGQMASGIAHDINNAISPISLYVESMLEREKNLTPQGRERLAIVQRAIDDVAQTVARMREFYRQRPQQLALIRLGVNPLIEQVVELTKARWLDMPQQRGVVIDLRTQLAPDLPPITGIEGEIREALTNLIFNAVDAMPTGGALTIRSFLESPPTLPSPGRAARRVVVEVTDAGTGMSEETLRRCLEPFFTTKGERGSGMGLAMVYGMVKRHNGDIELQSQPGQGTTVRLLFPVATAPAPLVDVPLVRPATPARILLVDDDPLLIKSVGEILQAEGHLVTTASGGQEGINLFTDALKHGEAFDVVITDLGMPYVDGRRVAAAIKAASPITPVFLLTGWGQRLVAEGEVPPDVDRVINKPPKLRDLREALATLHPEVRA